MLPLPASVSKRAPGDGLWVTEPAASLALQSRALSSSSGWEGGQQGWSPVTILLTAAVDHPRQGAAAAVGGPRRTRLGWRKAQSPSLAAAPSPGLMGAEPTLPAVCSHLCLGMASPAGPGIPPVEPSCDPAEPCPGEVWGVPAAAWGARGCPVPDVLPQAGGWLSWTLA